MQSLWKWQVPVLDRVTELDIPTGAVIQHIEVVGDSFSHFVWFWATVDPAAPIERRRFQVVGTGMGVPDTWRYIGTKPATASLVWHLFEVID